MCVSEIRDIWCMCVVRADLCIHALIFCNRFITLTLDASSVAWFSTSKRNRRKHVDTDLNYNSGCGWDVATKWLQIVTFLGIICSCLALPLFVLPCTGPQLSGNFHPAPKTNKKEEQVPPLYNTTTQVLVL